MHKLAFAFATVATLVLAPLTALASDPQIDGLPITGNPTVDALIKIVGALYIALSVLAALLPKDWKATRVFAKFAADLKGILQQKEEPEAKKKDD